MMCKSCGFYGSTHTYTLAPGGGWLCADCTLELRKQQKLLLTEDKIPLTAYRDMVLEIQSILSGTEWDSETPCRIGEVLTNGGLEVKEYEP